MHAYLLLMLQHFMSSVVDKHHFCGDINDHMLLVYLFNVTFHRSV